MTSSNVLIDLVLILAAAAGGGALAVWLKQPIILGYLVGGLVVGPFTPGPTANFEQFRFLVEVGLALLLFVLGTGMAPARFRGLGKVILVGGAVQIALTIGLGLLFIPWLNLSLAQGFLLGTILAQSSTAVIARLLGDRNETDSLHGRIAVGVSLVQDLSSIPILLLLMALLRGEGTLTSFLTALGEVFGLAAVTYLVGRLVWPRLLDWFGRLASGELTVITALGLALGGGLIMQAIGHSFAFGAFLAGLVIAESPQKPAAISKVAPLRDVFAAVFFVSIGALFDPSVFWRYPLLLLGILLTLIIGKALIGAVVTRCLGQTTPVAVMSGLLLAQIGEFAFILANVGLGQEALSQSLFSVIIAAAVISIFLNSLVLDSAFPVLSLIAGLGRFRRRKK